MLNKKLYILFYSKSNYDGSFKDLIRYNILSLYNKNIDVYNLRYFNILPENIIILSVEKKVYKQSL